MRRLSVLLLATVGCGRMVSQASHTGQDGELEGAEVLALDDDGSARAKDVVTYPGGDRVDWKVVELPKPGEVEVSLSWRPPRDGLDLSMNVYDENLVLLARARPSTMGKRRKEISVANAPEGRLYVQVYASTRQDAGAYTLEVDWKKGTGKPPVLEKIPDPPSLPKLEQQACLGPACPPPSCVGPSCPPAPQCVGPTCPPPCVGPSCPVTPPPPLPKKVKSAITELSTTNAGDVVVVLNRGSEDGVSKNWTGKILRENGKPLTTKTYDVIVTQVSDVECRALVRGLGLDEIGDLRRVVLEPPAPPAQ